MSALQGMKKSGPLTDALQPEEAVPLVLTGNESRSPLIFRAKEAQGTESEKESSALFCLADISPAGSPASVFHLAKDIHRTIPHKYRSAFILTQTVI